MPVINPVNDYSGPLVEVRNATDPLSIALRNHDYQLARALCESMLTNLERVVRWINEQ